MPSNKLPFLSFWYVTFPSVPDRTSFNEASKPDVPTRLDVLPSLFSFSWASPKNCEAKTPFGYIRPGVDSNPIPLIPASFIAVSISDFLLYDKPDPELPNDTWKSPL